MLRSIIKYGGLALIIIGIILVMKNLFKSDTNYKNDKKSKATTVIKSNEYNARIKLIDEETNDYIVGAKLELKNSENETITEWITDASEHVVLKLKKGTYTITEKEIPEKYQVVGEDTIFEIKNKDEKVTIYNRKLTDEEIAAKETEERKKNTVSNEVGVENTLSKKDITITIIAFICIIFGIDIIFFQKENNKA